MKLFEDRISSAVARVRIVLALKGVEVESVPISILGAEPRSRSADYLAINPQGLVPALLTNDGALITQSLAIVEYLDERFPEPALLPDDPVERALARSVALSIASDIHPLLPPRVAKRLGTIPGANSMTVRDWNRHWIQEGMTAIEALLSRQPERRFAVGDAPSIADVVLFPQAINAERTGLSLELWPRIAAVVATLRTISAFAANAPVPRSADASTE
ncbi:maleylacetoacetate isomerase [Azospirillum sp. A1-3]|uniref:maleylacetoacetate isomerase n=1 Tax=Azospirillum sp. A1-3 TaxID=185874 RepID=UPI0020776984|nr:maleylacetoacetate isomerase [Azospirillum sp. A1-3]MCM8735737.1 maleylacetoacetate isomerase [Azospirillum sp. A1-3]